MTKQKNPTVKKVREKMEIKPFYTTNELRIMIGYKTNHGARAFLQKLNIPCHVVGKWTYIWFLSDIQNHSPELFASLCEAANLKELISKQEIEVEDPEQYTSNQFK